MGANCGGSSKCEAGGKGQPHLKAALGAQTATVACQYQARWPGKALNNALCRAPGMHLTPNQLIALLLLFFHCLFVCLLVWCLLRTSRVSRCCRRPARPRLTALARSLTLCALTCRFYPIKIKIDQITLSAEISFSLALCVWLCCGNALACAGLFKNYCWNVQFYFNNILHNSGSVTCKLLLRYVNIVEVTNNYFITLRLMVWWYFVRYVQTRGSTRAGWLDVALRSEVEWKRRAQPQRLSRSERSVWVVWEPILLIVLNTAPVTPYPTTTWSASVLPEPSAIFRSI